MILWSYLDFAGKELDVVCLRLSKAGPGSLAAAN